MIDKGMVVLQNCIDLQNVVPDSYSETCETYPYDGSQIMNIKVEDVTDMKEEEDPVEITFPVIKAEQEVS
jgi:hypothetical protein